MSTLLKWLVPWEFSWLFLATFVLACVLYIRGVRRLRRRKPASAGSA